MAAPTPPGTGWPAGRIARGYAGFGLTPGMGLVVFGTSIERLAVGYGDLPALDGAEIRHIAWVLLEEHDGANIPNAHVDGSVLDALRRHLYVDGLSW